MHYSTFIPRKHIINLVKKSDSNSKLHTCGRISNDLIGSKTEGEVDTLSIHAIERHPLWPYITKGTKGATGVKRADKKVGLVPIKATGPPVMAHKETELQ